MKAEKKIFPTETQGKLRNFAFLFIVHVSNERAVQIRVRNSRNKQIETSYVLTETNLERAKLYAAFKKVQAQ